MKKLIILYDENITAPEDIIKANELINTSTDIEYIQSNLLEGISLAWEDKENDVLELI